jgi:hypothetical protein
MAAGRKWTVPELNLVRGASKQRQAEDRLRADAWRKNREAELEAVVNRSYDGMEIPEIRELIGKLSDLARPYIEKFDRLARAKSCARSLSTESASCSQRRRDPPPSSHQIPHMP